MHTAVPRSCASRFVQPEKEEQKRKKGEAAVPAAALDAPALGPYYNEGHRWVFCPDMRVDEAVLFKQYDWRAAAHHSGSSGSSSRITAKGSFHTSFRDHHHEPESSDGSSKTALSVPGRRSLECRVLLVFDTHVGQTKGGARL